MVARKTLFFVCPMCEGKRFELQLAVLSTDNRMLMVTKCASCRGTVTLNLDDIVAKLAKEE